ncbi:hypothetical protein LPB142_09860 [Rhodobacter xanthinilyticus]|uniref:Uncharacterized protein n=1 Tax=Rhodobacter xanthinilyticus TaxID=1850250 RepID=A0A1D9MCK0_9RHOB|nr:hypothetical protein [Rhodobacter xanthinilyticus]AOZ69582.1 hypothetical protein LPB142_09860 [Rhodobacter xanthinilyticus]
MSEDDLVAELAHELDRLMLEFVGRGLPGLHVLSAAHGHMVGRLAAICGPEGTAAHLRATAASVGRLPAKHEARTPAQVLAAAKPAGHA